MGRHDKMRKNMRKEEEETSIVPESENEKKTTQIFKSRPLLSRPHCRNKKMKNKTNKKREVLTFGWHVI